MTPRRRQRLLLLLGMLTLLTSGTGIVLYALSQNIDLFYTPGEILGQMDTGKKMPVTVGQRLRVGGLVVEGSVERDPQSLEIQFDLTDTSGEVITVFFTGILPDLFREGQGIIAQGQLIAAREVKATEVLAKHDENYMPPELAKSLGVEHKKPQALSEEGI